MYNINSDAYYFSRIFGHIPSEALAEPDRPLQETSVSVVEPPKKSFKLTAVLITSVFLLVGLSVGLVVNRNPVDAPQQTMSYQD